MAAKVEFHEQKAQAKVRLVDTRHQPHSNQLKTHFGLLETTWAAGADAGPWPRCGETQIKWW